MNFKTFTQLTPPYTNCKKCPVRNTTLFKDSDAEYLDKTQNYRKNQILLPAKSRLFQEGEKHDNLYSVFSGWSVIYKTVSNTGKRQILHFLLPGDLIAHQTNSSGTMPHSAGTISESIFCVFPRSALKQLLGDNKELALQLYNMESRALSLCQNHLTATGRKTAKERIIYLMLELFYRVQNQMKNAFNKDKNSIDFPLTQEDIGDALGLTNIHVNRVIKELEAEKLIKCGQKQLTILKEKKLCDMAEFDSDMVDNNMLLL